MEKWTFEHGWGWWIYCAITFGISAVCLVAHKRLWARKDTDPIKGQKVIMPIVYAIPSALLGGAQMIVQSKCLAELTELLVTSTYDDVLPIAHWFFWVELLLVSGFGLFWFFRLTQSLGMYEPLFIIPLMQVPATRAAAPSPLLPAFGSSRAPPPRCSVAHAAGGSRWAAAGQPPGSHALPRPH